MDSCGFRGQQRVQEKMSEKWEAGSLMVAVLKRKKKEERKQQEVVLPVVLPVVLLVPGCWHEGSCMSSNAH